MAKAIYKVVKKCVDCSNSCKQEVEEKVWANAEVLKCPHKSKQTSTKKKKN